MFSLLLLYYYYHLVERWNLHGMDIAMLFHLNIFLDGNQDDHSFYYYIIFFDEQYIYCVAAEWQLT